MMSMRNLMYVFLIAILSGSTPIVAQAQPDIVASAVRLASSAEATGTAQDEGSTILRRRSGTMAGLGVGLITVGVVMALREPKCGAMGSASDVTGFTRYTLSGIHRNGRCDVAIELSDEFGVRTEYLSDVRSGRGDWVVPSEVEGVSTTQSNALRHTGWALVGVGGAVLWYGLSRVEVPFRVDLTADRGVLASRSFGW